MKKLFTLMAFLVLSCGLFAQTPEKMSYQAVIRNSSNELVTSQEVGMQISILQGSASGSAVYVETHSTATNASGLISLDIGTGSVVDGDFTTIDWSAGPYFIKVETDPTQAGGTNYTITGTSELLSVPYALHSKTAEHIIGGITEGDPVFSEWDKSSGIEITKSQIRDLDPFTTGDETDPVFASSVSSKITADDTTRWNGKLSEYTEEDPLYSGSVSAEITAGDTARWSNKLDSESDPKFSSSVASKITADDTTRWGNKLDNYTESDPEFSSSVSAKITEEDTIRWGNKLDIENDPKFTSSVSSKITADDTSRWNNKLSDYIEEDPKFNSSISAGITKADTARWNAKLSSYTEKDSIFKASVSSKITADDTARWGRMLSTEEDPIFTTSVSSGITESDTTRWNSKVDIEQDPVFGSSVSSGISDADTTRWNNKLSTYTEEDPVYSSSVSAGITAADTTRWNNKLSDFTEKDPLYSVSVSAEITAEDTLRWGNKLDSENDPVFSTSVSSKITAADTTRWGNKVSTEIDPVYQSSVSAQITEDDTTRWNKKLDGYTETDPLFTASVSSEITPEDTVSWGNKLDNETDPLFSGSVSSGITESDTTRWNDKLDEETDPVFSSSVSAEITSEDTTRWGTEEDPVYSSSVSAGITATDTTRWNGKLNEEVDGSITNELQTITRSGLTVTLSDGGGTYQDSVNVYTAGDGIDITGTTVSEAKYQVGDFAHGGIVFWVDETGEHGLVCAKEDQEAGNARRWNNGTHNVTNAFGDGPLAGEMNTTIIIARQPYNYPYAALICSKLQINEGITYGDWYLPSTGELELMYQNLAVINNAAIANGGTAFQSTRYWGSTERDQFTAFYLDFGNGVTGYMGKGNSARIRAVRAF
jgi:hypothetical protein